MSQVIEQSLNKITKGAAIVFVGTIVGLLSGFGVRLLVARFFSQSQYGIYSLVVIILNIAVVISILGLDQGSTRQIAYSRGQVDTAKVKGLISSSLRLALIASILVSIMLFFTSGIISEEIFHEPGLVLPLKIVALSIPFSVEISMLGAIFLGFGEVKPTVYFVQILGNVLFLLLLVTVILLRLPFQSVVLALSASYFLTGIGFVVYAQKKAPRAARRYPATALQAKGLLLFSLPLLGGSMLSMAMDWADSLMLGYFKTAQEVGLYNGAVPLARLIRLALSSTIIIYLPVISKLYSQHLIAEIKRTYQVLTKWIFSISLPIFLILFLFPETVLGIFFGSQYGEAAMALRILSLGFMFHAFFGPNGMTLMAMGRTRLLLWANLLAAGSNVVLNVILIPLWGINGAAVASLSSYLILNVFFAATLYNLSKIHPFTKSYLKQIIACGTVMAVIYVLTRSLPVVSYWMLPLIFILFMVAYSLCLLLMKSFDKEDVMILVEAGKRLGLNLEAAMRILDKFL